MNNASEQREKRFDQSAEKRNQFQGGSAGKRKRFLFTVLIVAVAAIAVITSYYLLQGSKNDETVSPESPVLEERSYIGDFVSMTVVEATIEGEWLLIPLAAVDEHGIVYFEAENDEGFQVPLMAYVGPSGRIFAGSSMCEPCRGRTFSLAGETLVCDTCRTTYTIEEHEFISGSPVCGKYPPVSMEPIVEDGLIKIPLENILSWRIRAL